MATKSSTVTLILYRPNIRSPQANLLVKGRRNFFGRAWVEYPARTTRKLQHDRFLELVKINTQIFQTVFALANV